MSNSTAVPTETLTCATPGCGTFTRDRKRGVKPKHCPDCTQRLADEAKAAEAAVEKTQHLHCEKCGTDWERTAQRGKPPKVCDSCKPNRHVVRQHTPISTPTKPLHSGTGHYTVSRVLSERSGVPVEDQYKFAYIEAELARKGPDARSPKEQDALKRVWASLEDRL